MLNIFATSLLTANRTSHLYQTEKSPPRPSEVSQSDLDLFRKDLSKSPLTGFFSGYFFIVQRFTNSSNFSLGTSSLDEI